MIETRKAPRVIKNRAIKNESIKYKTNIKNFKKKFLKKIKYMPYLSMAFMKNF